jgi:hypothetical protein
MSDDIYRTKPHDRVSWYRPHLALAHRRLGSSASAVRWVEGAAREATE